MASRSSLVATSSFPSSTKSNSNSIEQEQPHLSGAYIRSLVKHLSSSSSSTTRSKAGQKLNTTMTNSMTGDHHRIQQQEQAPPPQKTQAKKQARRRAQTSRPYQERLLNMAEARREIVTALKIHRANMRRQQSMYQLQPPLLQLEQQQQVQVVFQGHQLGQAVGGAPMAAEHLSYASFSNHPYSSPLGASAVSASGCDASCTLPPCLTPIEAPAIDGCFVLDHGVEHLACSLPAQPLGLNLSFQGVNGYADDAKNSSDPFDLPPTQSSPASPYSAYSSPAVAIGSHGSEGHASVDAPAAAAVSRPGLDGDEVSAAIQYAIGEKHGAAEWSDTADAWWSKIVLESIEDGGERAAAAGREGADAAVGMAVDVMAGLPEWLMCDGIGEQGTPEAKPDALEVHLDGGYYYCGYGADHCADGEDIALSCLDIGDIEVWDREWFS
ncbi:hypothetical protein ACP70R_004741 [Stipagrostis hirtigluma subsp. patula]